jgi:transcriptional regulator with XRE-family HTH domain
MSEYGNRIKELRIEMSWTQQDLAERLQTTKQAVSQYERGVRKPDLDTLTALCDILNVSSDYLLGRSPVVPRLVDTTEKRIIDKFRTLSDAEKEMVCRMLGIER